MGKVPDGSDEMAGLFPGVPERSEEMVSPTGESMFLCFPPIPLELTVPEILCLGRFHVNGADGPDGGCILDHPDGPAGFVRHDPKGIPDDPVSVVMGDVDAEETGPFRHGSPRLDRRFFPVQDSCGEYSCQKDQEENRHKNDGSKIDFSPFFAS